MYDRKCNISFVNIIICIFIRIINVKYSKLKIKKKALQLKVFSFTATWLLKKVRETRKKVVLGEGHSLNELKLQEE